MENIQQHPDYAAARHQVRKLSGFYHHLSIYIMVISGLALINLISSPSRLWFLWTAFGWGIGLLAHASRVFRLNGKFGKDWEQKKIRELMEKSR
jgi:2TM domain